ncbi:MAG: methylenetetrahydrofolate dehydrogenase (NADP+)/methenyltetrahydrofolate cyclohydrolase, partial [Flavobacteriaceae bacterium]
MPILLDGKKIASDIKQEISTRVSELKAKDFRAPNLAIIIVGDDGASHTYVNGKIAACKSV